jgi:hypothetical protein
MSSTVGFTLTERRPFAEGRSLGDAGAYERIVGRAHYAVDPRHPANRDITDIAHAPVDADGLIRFSGDVMILKPVEMDRGNRRVVYEFVNRGNTRLLRYNDAPATNDPLTLEDAGNLFLMRRGYVAMWSGWQGDLYPGNGRMLLDVPVARDGAKRLTQRIATEFVVDAPGVYSLPLSGYISTRSNPTVSLDTREAVLTRRRYPDSPREAIPPTAWRFARFAGTGLPSARIIDEFRGNEQVILPSATDVFVEDGFKVGWIYELEYTACEPLVLGLGHAAVRDLVAFLRHDRGDANPLAWNGRTVEKVYAFGRSQTGRLIRDFVHKGFNADIAGRKVFDAVHTHVAGAGLFDYNRFGNLVVSSSRQYEDHYNPSDRFPFSYARTTDHFTGRTDAILKRPETDPLIVHTQSASEYWVRRGSLVHTTTRGEDLEQPEGVRIYAWLSTQHWSDPIIKEPKRGIRTNYFNIVRTSMFFRAALDMIDRWATDGTPPPPSRIPRRADGTLVSFEEWKASFPRIPGVALPQEPNRLEYLDYGPEADRGIVSRPPKVIDRAGYTIGVPAVDADGNDRAGVLAPMVRAPLGTYTGWNLRARPNAAGAMHQMYGSYIPLPETPEEREATGDPRRSILERYGSKEGYIRAIETAARALVAEGFMLEEDVARAVAEARNWSRPLHDVGLD